MVATKGLTINPPRSGRKSTAGAGGQMKGRLSRGYSALVEAIMTSVLALQGMASRIVYFCMTASAFIFISMLLTGIHP
jgi:hypothetical protein